MKGMLLACKKALFQSLKNNGLSRLSRLCIGILLGQLLLAFFVHGEVVAEGVDFTLEVKVDPNGSEVWSKTASTTVTVTGYDESQPLEYYWALSDNSAYTAKQTFTNGETLSHTGDGDWQLTLDVVDKGTGWRLPFTSSRFRLDNTAPTMNVTMAQANTQPYANDSWTSQTVHVTVNASDASQDGKASSGVASLEISTDNGNTWTPYNVNEEATLSLANSGTYHLHIKATDHAGNEALEQRVVKISKDGLYMNASLKQADDTPYLSGVWTKQRVTASISPHHSAGLNITSMAYSQNGGATWIPYTAPITFIEGLYSFSFQVKDETGYELIEQFSIQIDQTAPEIRFTPNGNENFTRTATTAVNVTDLGSGVDEASLSYVWTPSGTTPDAQANWQSFTNGATLSHTGDDGDWYLHVRAQDHAGNMVNKSSQRFRMDNTAPTMNIAMTQANTQPYANDSWTSQTVQVTANATDEHQDGKGSSGVASLEISTDNGNTWTPYNVNEEATLSLANSGTYHLHIKATDHAGNETLEQRVVKISKDGLDMNASLKQADDTPYISGDWTKQSVVASIAPSHVQGLAITSRVYSLDEGTSWNSYTFPLTFATEGIQSLWFKVEDETGHELTEQFNIQIDQTAPEIQFTSDGSEFFAHAASTEVTVTDLGSGVDEASLSYVWAPSSTTPDAQANWQPFTNGATLSHTGDDGDWYLHVRAQDHAGNMVNKSSQRFRLDDPSKRNAQLNNLLLNAKAIQNFTPDVTEYTVHVGYDVANLTITPIAEEATATVAVRSGNGAYTTVPIGSAGLPLALQVGANKVDIMVTASNGKTTKNYTVNIVRAATQIGGGGSGSGGSSDVPIQSSKALLSGVILSEGVTLSPAFSKDISQYTAHVANEVTSLTVRPTTDLLGATITINGKQINANEESQTIALKNGKNKIIILVATKDGAKQAYVITVTREAASLAQDRIANLTSSWVETLFREGAFVGGFNGYLTEPCKQFLRMLVLSLR